MGGRRRTLLVPEAARALARLRNDPSVLARAEEPSASAVERFRELARAVVRRRRSQAD